MKKKTLLTEHRNSVHFLDLILLEQRLQKIRNIPFDYQAMFEKYLEKNCSEHMLFDGNPQIALYKLSEFVAYLRFQIDCATLQPVCF